MERRFALGSIMPRSAVGALRGSTDGARKRACLGCAAAGETAVVDSGVVLLCLPEHASGRGCTCCCQFRDFYIDVWARLGWPAKWCTHVNALGRAIDRHYSAVRMCGRMLTRDHAHACAWLDRYAVGL